MVRWISFNFFLLLLYTHLHTFICCSFTLLLLLLLVFLLLFLLLLFLFQILDLFHVTAAIFPILIYILSMLSLLADNDVVWFIFHIRTEGVTLDILSWGLRIPLGIVVINELPRRCPVYSTFTSFFFLLFFSFILVLFFFTITTPSSFVYCAVWPHVSSLLCIHLTTKKKKRKNRYPLSSIRIPFSKPSNASLIFLIQIRIWK